MNRKIISLYKRGKTVNLVNKIVIITLICWGQTALNSEAQRMSPELMKGKAKTLHTFTQDLKIAEKNINTACLDGLTDQISTALTQWLPKFKSGVDKIHQEFILLKNQNSYKKLTPQEIKQLCDDLTYYYKFIATWTNQAHFNDMQKLFKGVNPYHGAGFHDLNELKNYLTTAKTQTILKDIIDIAEQIPATITDRTISDLHIRIKIFTPHGQTPTAPTSSPSPAPAPRPTPKPKPVTQNIKFWNVSSKTLTIIPQSEPGRTILASGKLWRPLSIDKTGYMIECEGFKPIMIQLAYIKTDIIAIDAGTYLFGSKVPEMKKIKFQYFTTTQARQYAQKNKLNAQNL